jgi:eukaryotic-like serine/threonine-protein kinase
MSMYTQVALTLIDGSLAGKQYLFNEARNCFIGRGSDCEVRLPNKLEYMSVSRHHCLLEVDPPEVRVRDLESTNGTYVNGLRIGSGLGAELPRDGVPFIAFDLDDGDTLRVGDTRFWVEVLEQSSAAESHESKAEKSLAAALAEPRLS